MKSYVSQCWSGWHQRVARPSYSQIQPCRKSYTSIVLIGYDLTTVGSLVVIGSTKKKEQESNGRTTVAVRPLPRRLGNFRYPHSLTVHCPSCSACLAGAVLMVRRNRSCRGMFSG